AYSDRRHLHSFPTRRSSDLTAQRSLRGRRPFPGMDLPALRRAHLHDVARVQEGLHGRVDRPGRHRSRRAPARKSRRGRAPGASGVRAMSRVALEARPLPPVAARVDSELARLDEEVDWLLALSPIHNNALW